MNAAVRRVSTRTILVIGSVISLFLAGVVSYYASGHPDGLEYVAGGLGFGSSAQDSATAGSPLADYGVSSISDARLSGGAAGVLGVIAVGALMAALVWLLRRRTARETT